MVVCTVVVLALFFGRSIPISLLPSVSIPRITVSISSPDKTARIIENTITRPVRNQLMQMGHLEYMESTSRNGSAFIELQLSHGTNTDLSFIEANEKIDQAMNLLPRDVSRPRVVKSTLTDVPIFYIAVVPRDVRQVDPLELSEFAEKVIKRRLEQLQEIAFVDLHGLSVPEILVSPKMDKLLSLGINEEQLAQQIRNHNIDLGNIMIRDGQYQYNIELGAGLISLSDLEQVYITVHNQIYQLKDLADITVRPSERRSGYLWDEKPGVLLSIRKREDANNFTLKEKVEVLLADMHENYPLVDLQVHNDQSAILELSYQNLRTSLLYGILFSGMVLFLFFREWRLPVLIIFTVPLGLLVSLLGFYLAGISINIISLAGLILGIGLMIDNAIIIIDNIRQHAVLQTKKDENYISGTVEVIRPLISSAMTTCSVFLPLILISGVAGALFYDQAISITIALTSSLLVSFFVLPVIARLLLRKTVNQKSMHKGVLHRLHTSLVLKILHYYKLIFVIFLLLSAGGYFIYRVLNVEAFPAITADGMEVHIDWNENIDVRENENRIANLYRKVSPYISQMSSIIGEKQFLLIDEETGINEAEIYARLDSPDHFNAAKNSVNAWINEHHHQAQFTVFPVKNTFDYIFGQEKAPLIAHIQPIGKIEIPPLDQISDVVDQVRNVFPGFKTPPQDEYLEITIKTDILETYGLEYQALVNKIKALFNSFEVSKLRSSDRFIPIILGIDAGQDLYSILHDQSVQNKNGEYIPLHLLVNVRKISYYKEIKSTITGESFPVHFPDYNPGYMTHLKSSLTREGRYHLFFEGQHFENEKLLKQLTSIFLIVLVLLYLILAAQFESFVQPLIVLLIVPVSAMGALGLLYLTGQTLNTVSMVGIIVMAGIIVNDAILKIDMINKNLAASMDLDKSILVASERRLQPIIMTSLTTILAFMPVLFTSGMGAEIQTPLALAIIGGLIVGTLSSLVFIPVLFLVMRGSRSKGKTSSERL